MIDTDTIVAVATAPGRGAVAIIRVSGPDALSVVREIAPRLRDHVVPRQSVLVRLEDPESGRTLDRALVTYFEAPASYTGEHVVELSTHGGSLLPAVVVSALEGAGARLARPGEFTQRAFLNGKIDLIQAEGVRDAIDARSPAFHAAAVHQMEGGLSRRIAALRDDLIGLEALLAHHIDFPEEDEPPTPIARVVEDAERVASRLETLLASAPQGELLREGALVVFGGRPNAGKSSLFNALLGMERAIVTEEPGTTRDALEATVSIEGYPFRLVDTAGIREAVGEVERRGVDVARRYVKAADIVVLCVSAEWGWGDGEEAFVRGLDAALLIVAETKVDAWTAGGGGVPDTVSRVVAVSAREGIGLDELGSALVHAVFGRGRDATDRDVYLTHRRQVRGVRVGLEELRSFVAAIESGIPAEIAATHLSSAGSALEALLGVVSPDDVLDRLFADFCIGK